MSSAYRERDELNATFPVGGGAGVASTADVVDVLEPFSGARGPFVIFSGQAAPNGWNGGLTKVGKLQFAVSDRAFSLQPGSIQNGFEVSSRRPPTIREVSVEPWWVPLYENHNTVTEAESIAIRVTQDSLPVSTFALGPTDFFSGERLRDDLLQAQAIGWITDLQLLADLLAILDAAIAAHDAGDFFVAQDLYQDFIDAVNAAPVGSMNTEATQLAVLNADHLIFTALSNLSEPTVIVNPQRVTLEVGSEFDLEVLFIDILQDNQPIANSELRFRCLVGSICANYNPVPHDEEVTDSDGQILFQLFGDNLGIDRIEIGQGEGSSFFERLAIAEILWIPPQTDMTVPLFIPPVIKASSGDTIVLTDRTANRGPADVAVPTTTTYYISATEPVDPNTATVLGQRTVPPLLAGAANDSVTVPYEIPPGFAGEFNYLLACADTGQMVLESDEDNNCSSSTFGMTFAPVGVIESDFTANVSVTGVSVQEGDTGVTTAQVQVSINAADPFADMSVELSTSDATGVAGEDYEALGPTTILFESGTTTLSQTVPINIIGDFDIELDESFTVNLTNPSVNVSIAGDSDVVTIENDDLAAISVSDVAASEGDSGTSNFTFNITIDQAHPSETISVSYQTQDISAVDPEDFVGVNGQVDFAAGAQQLTSPVTVSVVGDTIVEPDEAFAFVLSSASANASILDGIGLGTIINDDSQMALDCTNAFVNPGMLWPPNHKLVTISFGGVLGGDGNAAEFAVTSVYQDELVDGLGDGDTSPDAFGVGTGSVQLRRERSGTGDGRIYEIGFDASDSAGATCSGTLFVGVPHDQGLGSTPIDSGVRFDSTTAQ